MRLYDLLECFDLSTPILIIDRSGKIIDDTIAGEVTQKTMNHREVLRTFHEKDRLVVTTCCE